MTTKKEEHPVFNKEYLKQCLDNVENIGIPYLESYIPFGKVQTDSIGTPISIILEEDMLKYKSMVEQEIKVIEMGGK